MTSGGRQEAAFSRRLLATFESDVLLLQLSARPRSRISTWARQLFHIAVASDLSWGTPHDEDVRQGAWKDVSLTFRLSGSGEQHTWRFGGDLTAAQASFDNLVAAARAGSAQLRAVLAGED